MRIALLNDTAQSSKNGVIYQTLKKICDNNHYELYNYGVSEEQKEKLTYVQVALLGALLLNSKAVDFVVTGCGTGQGVMIALNSFPNVECGLIETPTDAYLFSQINGGNAISLPFSKGFGLGSEINLQYIFEKIFSAPFLEGYPKERKEDIKRNKEILKKMKQVTHQDFLTILKSLDQDFLKETVDREEFMEYFFQNAKEGQIVEFIKQLF